MSKRVGYIISSILSVVIAGLFFFNWIGASVMNILGSGGSSWLTSIKVFTQGKELEDLINTVFSQFGDILGADKISTVMTITKVIAAIVLIIIALSIICFAVYIIKGAVSGKKHKKWGVIGTVLAMLLAVVTVLLPIICTAIATSIAENMLNSLSDSFSYLGMGEMLNTKDIHDLVSTLVHDSFKITLVPYVVLGLSALSLIFMTALDKGKQVMEYAGYPYSSDAYSDNNYDNNYDNGYDNTVSNEAGMRECPACGGINPDIAVFCKQCGYRFNEPDTYNMDYADGRQPIDPTRYIPHEPEPTPYTPPEYIPHEPEPTSYTPPVEPASYTPAAEPEPTPYMPSEPTAAPKKSEWSRANDMLDLSGGANSGKDDNNGGSSLKINM